MSADERVEPELRARVLREIEERLIAEMGHVKHSMLGGLYRAVEIVHRLRVREGGS